MAMVVGAGTTATVFILSTYLVPQPLGTGLRVVRGLSEMAGILALGLTTLYKMS